MKDKKSNKEPLLHNCALQKQKNINSEIKLCMKILNPGRKWAVSSPLPNRTACTVRETALRSDIGTRSATPSRLVRLEHGFCLRLHSVPNYWRCPCRLLTIPFRPITATPGLSPSYFQKEDHVMMRNQTFSNSYL